MARSVLWLGRCQAYFPEEFYNKAQASSTVSVKEYFLSSICRVQDSSKHYEITSLLGMQ